MRVNTEFEQTPLQKKELDDFLTERNIKGSVRDKRVEALFCFGCHKLLPLEKFVVKKSADGISMKVRLCEDCRQQKLTPYKIRKRRAIQMCTTCQQEREINDFMGSKFVGDPYENKSKICRFCREYFESLKTNFVTTAYPVCPICKETKNTYDFPKYLDEPHLKKAQEFLGEMEIRLNRVCSTCRKTKIMADLALYLKRVAIKLSKKKSVAKV